MKEYFERKGYNMTIEEMKRMRLTPIEDYITEDYGEEGTPSRMEFEARVDAFILGERLKEERRKAGLTQEQLAHVQFPLGDQDKTKTREIAAESGFNNAQKHDSQDICFVPDGDYAGFIERYSGVKCPPGDFVDAQGNVLGRHKGIIHYTLGQRRGLGIPAAHRCYVTKIDPGTNTVTLGTNDDLMKRTLYAGKVNLITVDRIDSPLRCSAKIRYRHKEQPCTVTQPEDDLLKVEFDEPQRAITPGQSVVLYDGDVVIGGGVIM
jgi:tRNA-specific 2-thiouridylase